MELVSASVCTAFIMLLTCIFIAVVLAVNPHDHMIGRASHNGAIAIAIDGAHNSAKTRALLRYARRGDHRFLFLLSDNIPYRNALKLARHCFVYKQLLGLKFPALNDEDLQKLSDREIVTILKNRRRVFKLAFRAKLDYVMFPDRLPSSQITRLVKICNQIKIVPFATSFYWGHNFRQHVYIMRSILSVPKYSSAIAVIDGSQEDVLKMTRLFKYYYYLFFKSDMSCTTTNCPDEDRLQVFNTGEMYKSMSAYFRISDFNLAVTPLSVDATSRSHFYDGFLPTAYGKMIPNSQKLKDQEKRHPQKTGWIYDPNTSEDTNSDDDSSFERTEEKEAKLMETIRRSHLCNIM